MNPGIFREYDLRGQVGLDYTIEDFQTIGRGFGTMLRQYGGRGAVVGRDCRLSSPALREAIINGLLAAGIQVIDVGVCPTPVLYFALRHLPVDGGLMITASHNPPEYNGLKICRGHETIFGTEIQGFRRLIEAGDFSTGNGSLELYDIIPDYSNYLTNNLKISRPVRFALDAGNGTGGVVAGPICRSLGSPPIELFFEMDGRFPNHEADPTVAKNMTALARTVVDQCLELGIGLDGDADRIGVVDEKGRIIHGDMITLLYAREIISEHPGAKIIGDVKCSQNLFNEVNKRGGRAIMWKTGHSLMKQKVRDEKAALGGEMSGHIFFNDRYFGFDDSIYAVGRFLEIVARSDRPVSELLDDLPPMVSTPEIRVDCPEEHKFRVVDLVKERLRQDHEIIDLDGVRVMFPDGWGLLRASNTGPVLVMRFEAQTSERLSEIQSLVEETLAWAKGRL